MRAPFVLGLALAAAATGAQAQLQLFDNERMLTQPVEPGVVAPRPAGAARPARCARARRPARP